MVANATRILYTGITAHLEKRVWEHKAGTFQGFTAHFDVCRLVYWESFDDVHKAINREKQLKNWRRDKKEWLIQRVNPGWKDLAADWYGKEETQGPSTPLRFARDDRSVVDQNAAVAPEAGTDPSIQASHKKAS